MDNMDCSYCTGQATGLDEDNEPTCGGATCEPATKPLPRVVEVSTDCAYCTEGGE